MLQLSALNSRTEIDLAGLRRAGAVAAQCLRAAVSAARSGVHTRDVDAVVETRMHELGAEPLFRGYTQGTHPPFPGVCCVSINDEVVHGVPGDRVIEPGDLVSIDVGVRADGWCADNARSLVADAERIIANPELATSPLTARVRRRLRLLEQTRATLALCVRTMRPGVRWSAVADAAEKHARKQELGIVTEFVGHGIGRELHEPPKAPCFTTGYTGEDFVLRPGMTLAVEPILTLDGPRAWLPGNPPGPRNRSRVRTDGPAWGVRTATGVDACHEEHTILITPFGVEVLTGD
ncbi:MAG: type I methionyl aminopeptidase [Phycisphaerales bacterium]